MRGFFTLFNYLTASLYLYVYGCVYTTRKTALGSGSARYVASFPEPRRADPCSVNAPRLGSALKWLPFSLLGRLGFAKLSRVTDRPSSCGEHLGIHSNDVSRALASPWLRVCVKNTAQFSATWLGSELGSVNAASISLCPYLFLGMVSGCSCLVLPLWCETVCPLMRSSSSFHRLDMTLAVAEALNPNKPKPKPLVRQSIIDHA